MLKSIFNNIQIAAVACAVPTNEVFPSDFYGKFGKEMVDKTIKMLGVKCSRRSVKKQIASDLGYEAAKAILIEKDIDLKSIGALVYVTQTPDYPNPASAAILHKRLGLSQDCAALDINMGCSGFIYGAHIACSMLNNLNCERVLYIGGDTASKAISPDSRVSSLLIGDGTAAVLFEKRIDTEPIEIALRTDGSRYYALITPFGGFRGETYSEEELKIGYRAYPYPLMNGADVFTFGINDVTEHVSQFLKERNESITDYDSVALHQPNLFMLKHIAKKIKVTSDQLLVSIDRYGNTSGASIPLTLVDGYGEVNSDKEINVLMCGFGIGLSWGVMNAKICISDILPMIFTDEYLDDPNLDEQVYDDMN